MSERMETNEVSPPDSLPMEQLFVPAKSGIAYINALFECGFVRFEVTSSTSPGAIPAHQAVARSVIARRLAAHGVQPALPSIA